jgi:3',5'-cyclic AMP phosphodiesterase CpdA
VTPRLLAISDLHLEHPENQEVVEALAPEDPDDWLIVAGDVADDLDVCERALGRLRERFATVVWVPGNHELWTRTGGPRGTARYLELVARCRRIGVLTPEDEFAVWTGPGGPATVAPLFVLYDYTFRDAATQEDALAQAHAAGVVCADEALLDPEPYPSREAWCRARVAESRRRLERRDRAVPTVLVNHFPLLRELTAPLRHPEFAQWCGTDATADWHRTYDAACVVYGHLHIPRGTTHDGVRFQEVSLGYPREWTRRRSTNLPPRQILPHERRP